MSIDKPFRKIHELIAALSAAETGLAAGTLDLDGLETASSDARELYERLVVLRHKARESTSNTPPKRVPEPPPVPAVEALDRQEPPPGPSLSEAPTVRLDTRPALEVAPRQTSLIEAIASTEQERPAATTTLATPTAPARAVEGKGSPRPPTSVAEKLEKAALADLGKAISLSHKFWFVAELFNGDRTAYDSSIERLNNFANVQEAQRYVQEEVIARLKKPADPEALATFAELVQRRYP